MPKKLPEFLKEMGLGGNALNQGEFADALKYFQSALKCCYDGYFGEDKQNYINRIQKLIEEANQKIKDPSVPGSNGGNKLPGGHGDDNGDER